jgi:hypothetical chaperone protein
MARQHAAALGIDFGTSNSAVAVADGDGPARHVPLEGTATTIPSAIFFNGEDHKVYFGREAISLYLAGVDGRLMRSLKSLLGSPLLQEQTAVPDGRVSFEDILTRFLKELRQRAGTHLGRDCDRAVIGRPVHFVDDSAQRDTRAQQDLARAAAAAGFSEVAFELEPIAAAFDYERRVEREARVLITDIGGGTSDFTVVRLGPKRIARKDRSDDVLATGGVHIGGTDYDRKLSLELVMPLLGLRHIGPQGREVPSAVFFDLATWHLINLQYTPRAMRDALDLRTSYSDLALHNRLMGVLELHLGHQLAGAVEDAKIAASGSAEAAMLDLSSIAPKLAAALDARALQEHLAQLLAKVVDGARGCVLRAGLKPGQLDAIYLTGGSSALLPYQQALREAFPGIALVEGDLFGGVAAGLGYAAGRLLAGKP